MQLENMMGMYQPRVSEIRQQVYQVVDLESLSASALYTGDLPPMGPGSHGLPSINRDLDVGTSNYKTFVPNPSPYPTLVIKTPTALGILDHQGVIFGQGSLTYLNLKGENLGKITDLNSSEMDLLSEKHGLSPASLRILGLEY